MDTQRERSTVDYETLASDRGAPWVGVHVMTEFIYCPRAGVLMHESKDDDRGHDSVRTPRLDEAIWYNRDRLEATLEDACNEIWRVFTWAVPIGIAIVIAGLMTTWWLWLSAVPMGLWLLTWLIEKSELIDDLKRRLELEDQAAQNRPDPQATYPQEINWWSLLKSGFEALEYEDPHKDPKLRVSGRPWRVLRDGSTRIPVFRKSRGEARLWTQHYVRIAAYCHLVECMEGGSVPYGIVIFEDGYSGVTVPNTEQGRWPFWEGLELARRMLKDLSQFPPGPPEPRYSGKCSNCPLGSPRQCRRQKATFPARASNGKYYRSDCGDRFQWIPPHEWAFKRRLS